MPSIVSTYRLQHSQLAPSTRKEKSREGHSETEVPSAEAGRQSPLRQEALVPQAHGWLAFGASGPPCRFVWP